MTLDLPLRPFMLMSSDTLLVSLGLDIAEELKWCLFAISLLGTTIQDGGIEADGSHASSSSKK